MNEAKTLGIPTYDVAVAGSGFAGLALAAALAKAGLAVLVADPASAETLTAQGYDGRASAMALASIRLLRELDAWDDGNSQPIQDIRVSDGDSLMFVHYDSRRLGGEPFGALIENRFLRARLFSAATAAGATVRGGTGIARVVPDAFGAEVVLSNGDRVRARLVVAADGARSGLRTMAGIGVRGWRYRQTGIVLTVAHERPHGGIAHERFLPNGPFAILPLPGNRSSLVWTEREDTAPAILALSPDRFLEELRARFGDFLGDVTVTGPRWHYPLALQQAERYTADRLVLIGDAAHVMHPIAGQGLNLGLRDVAALAEVVVDAARLGLDFGAADVLDRYQRWRRADSLTLLTVTDSLNRLFATDFAPVRMVRDIGLGVVNQIEPLKRLLSAHAQGTVGKLPRLNAGQPL